MDYCPPCRRHLNGALSCPGCGKPVEELELPTAGSGAAEADAGADGASDAPLSRAERRRAQRSSSGATRRKPKSRGGRARRARPGRARRRVVMAAVLGPVLAALFVAELANEGYFREPSPTPASEKPVADRGGGVTESAEPVVRDSGGPSAGPATGSGRPDDDGGDREKKKDGDAKKAKATPSPDPGTPASDAPEPSAPATGGSGPSRPSTPATSKPRPTAPGPSEPAPIPTPSETCDRFLWWCT
ncbi:SCO2400 family protein [Streptomyces cucumeris]|uniref:SCO2400 family protein n=1 Tax=Streptomyces cucumeris TaxID=2962890 RepID=UPI003D739EC3